MLKKLRMLLDGFGFISVRKTRRLPANKHAAKICRYCQAAVIAGQKVCRNCLTPAATGMACERWVQDGLKRQEELVEHIDAVKSGRLLPAHFLKQSCGISSCAL